MRRILALLLVLTALCSVTGCAVVRDPLPTPGNPDGQIVFLGWGKVVISHEKDKDTEVYEFQRDINTSEVLVEVSGVIGAIGTVLALLF